MSKHRIKYKENDKNIGLEHNSTSLGKQDITEKRKTKAGSVAMEEDERDEVDRQEITPGHTTDGARTKIAD